MKKILSIDGGGIRGLIPALTPIGGATKALIDGGIFINSPSVSAYAEAKKIFPDETEFCLSGGCLG